MQPHKKKNINYLDHPELPGIKPSREEYKWREPLFHIHTKQRMALFDIIVKGGTREGRC